MTTFSIEADGASLECRWIARERGSAGAIVLLHEGLGSLAMWKRFPEQLAEATQRAVFVYSRRGYGQSAPCLANREPDYMHHEAREVLPAVLNAAEVERPILFGHSDGASIALLFAASYPSKVCGLVLEAPHVFVEQLTIDSIAEARVSFESTDLVKKLGRYHARPDHAFRGWNDIWLDARFRDWNITAECAKIRCPILLIQGDQDEYGTAAQIEAITKAQPNAKVLFLNACGHSPHRDNPQQVLIATTELVSSLETAWA